MANHKMADISLTVRDRAISSKFSILRVYMQDTLPKFQNIFVKIFDPQGTIASYSAQILKNFRLSKNGGHFEFSNFQQKHKIAHIFLTVRDRGNTNFS